MHSAAPMIDNETATPSPFDEDKLRLVREFLQREFRTSRREDYFHSVEMAQVFRIEPSKGPGHTLMIPKGTFEHPGSRCSSTRDSSRRCKAHSTPRSS